MNKAASTFFLLLFFPLALFYNVSAQMSEINRILAQADSAAKADDVVRARRFYRRALKMDRTSTAALNGLGDLAFAQEKFGDAGDFFNRTLEISPENPHATLKRGVCYRESGKFKALMLRKRDFDKARRYFEKVLARDSTFQDVLFQYALLQRLRKNYTAALLLGHAQKRLKPALRVSQTGLLRLYRFFIDDGKKLKVKAWLEDQPTEEARWALAEFHRLRGNSEEAERLLIDLLQNAKSIASQPLLLSLAKTSYKLDKTEDGEKYFWRAVGEITNAREASYVFEDVKYVLTGAEFNEYRNLAESSAFVRFFRKIWRKRDPLPAAAANPRLTEHYRRLLKAEKNYHFDGVRSWVNNPDKLGYLTFPKTYKLNDLFNDKGLILIRHGVPDDRAFTVNEFSQTNESWRYYQRGNAPEMAFHFMIDASASGNNWRLVARIDDPRIAEALESWAPEYNALTRRSRLGRIQASERLARQNSEYVKRGLSTDRHRWGKNIKPLDISFFTAAFRAQNGQTAFEIYFSLPVKKNLQKPQKKKKGKILVEQGAVLLDASWRDAARRTERKSYAFEAVKRARRAEIIGAFQMLAQPSRYRAAFHAKIVGTDFIGGYNFPVNIPAFDSDSLMLSDIITANNIASAAANDSGVVKNGLSLAPNPTRRYKKSQPVYLYFEVYNLVLADDQKTDFDIEYTLTSKASKGGVKKVFGILGSDQKSVTVTSHRSGADATSIEYIALDLSTASKGEHTLKIRVSDNLAKMDRMKEIGLTVF